MFVVTDDVDEIRDRSIADHVLRMHRYLPPGAEDGTPVSDSHVQWLSVEASPNESSSAAMPAQSPFERYDSLLHAGLTRSGRRSRNKNSKEILTIAFVKKYIQYARARTPPQLTQAAANWITEAYTKLRNDDNDKNTKRVSCHSVCDNLL